VFANRFTALLDACVLASPLKRNLLLSLAEAAFFRPRWSERIMDETERAIEKLMTDKGFENPTADAARARSAMERAFEDAMVTGFENLEAGFGDLPDAGDRHVLAAAVKTRASIIVTDNLRDFPDAILRPLDLEAKDADAFIADTIDLRVAQAVPALRRMRERLRRPEKTPETLLLDMEKIGLTLTADALRDHIGSL
jgi:predicted nucleic acid-binding protein